MSNRIGLAHLDVDINQASLQRNAGAALARLLPSFSKFGKVAGIATGVALGVQVAKWGQELHDAQEQLRTQTGETGKALASSWKDVEQVAKTTPVSFMDAAKAIAFAKQRLNETGPVAVRLAQQMAGLARITGTDVAQNMDDAAVMARRWGLSLHELPRFMNEVYRVSERTGSSVQSIEENMVTGGQVLRQYGFNFQEAAVLVGRFEQQGVNVSRVLFGMRTGLAKMAKEGKDPVKFLQSLEERMRKAKSATDATGIAAKWFGARAGAELASAARRGAFAVDGMARSIKAGGDTIQNADKQTRDLGEQWMILRNKILVAISPIAIALFEKLGGGLDYVNQHFGTVKSAAQDVGSVFQGTSGKILLIAGSMVAGAKAAQALSVGVSAINTAVLNLRTMPTGVLSGWLAANWWIGAAAVAVGIGVALYEFGGQASIAGRFAQQAADATNNLADAMAGLKNLQHDTKTAFDEMKGALIAAQKQSRESAADEAKYPKGSLAYRDAVNRNALAWDYYGSAVRRWKGLSDKLPPAHKKITDAMHDQGKAITGLNTALKEQDDRMKKMLPRGGSLEETYGKLESRVSRYRDAVQGLIDKEIHLGTAWNNAKPAQEGAHRRMLLMSLAAEDLSKKIHGVPTTHAVWVYYRQNMQRLINQALALRTGILNIPLSRTVRLYIDEIHRKYDTSGLAGSQSNQPIPHAAGAVITRPELAWLGETTASRPEIVSPASLMRKIVREEGGGNVHVDIQFHDPELKNLIDVRVSRANERTAARAQAGKVWVTR